FWFGGGRSSNDRDRGGGGGLQALFFILAIVLSILAPIASRLVQLAVSRQREFLADASSVEVTRNPQGLERALETIAMDRDVRVVHPMANRCAAGRILSADVHPMQGPRTCPPGPVGCVHGVHRPANLVRPVHHRGAGKPTAARSDDGRSLLSVARGPWYSRHR